MRLVKLAGGPSSLGKAAGAKAPVWWKGETGMACGGLECLAMAASQGDGNVRLAVPMEVSAGSAAAGAEPKAGTVVGLCGAALPELRLHQPRQCAVMAAAVRKDIKLTFKAPSA